MVNYSVKKNLSIYTSIYPFINFTLILSLYDQKYTVHVFHYMLLIVLHNLWPNLASVVRSTIHYPSLLYRTWGPCCWYFRCNHQRSWTLCWRTAFTTFYRCVGTTRSNRRPCHSPSHPHSNAPTRIRGRVRRKRTKSKVRISSLVYSDLCWGFFHNFNFPLSLCSILNVDVTLYKNCY